MIPEYVYEILRSTAVEACPEIPQNHGAILTLVSDGNGPRGFSQNTIWKCHWAKPEPFDLILKIGDGPMPELVEKEINFFQYVFPSGHLHLPKVFAMSRLPKPYILMEHLRMPDEENDHSALSMDALLEIVLALARIVRSVPLERLLSSKLAQLTAQGSQECPLALSCGGLTIRNVGYRGDTCVIFDWDGVAIAPLGVDLSNFKAHPLFGQAVAEFWRQVLADF